MRKSKVSNPKVVKHTLKERAALRAFKRKNGPSRKRRTERRAHLQPPLLTIEEYIGEYPRLGQLTKMLAFQESFTTPIAPRKLTEWDSALDAYIVTTFGPGPDGAL